MTYVIRGRGKEGIRWTYTWFVYLITLNNPKDSVNQDKEALFPYSLNRGVESGNKVLNGALDQTCRPE